MPEEYGCVGLYREEAVAISVASSLLKCVLISHAADGLRTIEKVDCKIGLKARNERFDPCHRNVQGQRRKKQKENIYLGLGFHKT